MPVRSSARRSNAPSPPTLSDSEQGNSDSKEPSSDAPLSGCVDDSILGQADSELAAAPEEAGTEVRAVTGIDSHAEANTCGFPKRLRYSSSNTGRETTAGAESAARGPPPSTSHANRRSNAAQLGVTLWPGDHAGGALTTSMMLTPSLMPAAGIESTLSRSSLSPAGAVSVAPRQDGVAETTSNSRRQLERLANVPHPQHVNRANCISGDDSSMGTSTGAETIDTPRAETKSVSRPRVQPIPAPDSLRYIRAGRAGHAMVALDGRVYFFGGYRVSNGEPHPSSLPPAGLFVQTPGERNRYRIHFNDLVEFDCDTQQWRLLSNPADIQPSARRHASMVSFAGALYVYGGFDASNRVLGDLWRFDLSMERHWVLVSCVNLSTALGNTYQHPQVSVHTADAGLRTMPVPAEHVGVTDEQTRTATTRVVERDSFRTPETRTEGYSYTRLTLPRNRVMITPRETTPEGSPDTEVPTIGPAIGLPAGGPSPGRAEHSAIVYRHVMVVFGGYDGRRKVNTIAVVDLHSGRWFCPRPLHEIHASGRPGVDYPHRRCKHSAVVHCNKMYVFGGFQYRNKVNYGCSDLFVLDLNTWTWQGPLLMHGDGPQAIQGHAAVACLDSMYVFGGKVRMQRSMVSGHAVPSSPGRAALPAAGTAGISPTPPELRSSGLNGDIWEYRFDVNKWRRIAFHQRTVASTGETSSERMPIEPEPRQLAGLAVIADQNPLRCTVYLFGGVNKTKDHFFGDMYAFYGLGSDNYRALRPCALCADLGKALNDPSLADVIFTVAERVQMSMKNMATVLDSGSSEAARALGAPPRSSMAEAPTHQYDSMDTNTTDSSIDDSDNDRESSAHVDAEHVSSTDPIGTVSFPARQPWPMRRFYAHRVILASRSEYFANMFRTGLWESGHGSGPRVIHLPGISAAVFEAVLRYLYTGELHYPSTIVETPATGHVTAAGDLHGIRSDSARNSELRGYFMLELLQAADMLRLDQLRDLCAAQVEQALCPENVAFVLEMAAQSQDGMGGLKAYCVAYIIHHFAQVIQTIAWQNLLRRDPAGLGREVLQAYYESTAGPGSQHSAEGR